MADDATADQLSAAGRRRSRATSSRSSLQKEFKPKTDEAKSAVEQAVQTLAQQALAQHQADRQRRRSKSIEAMIAEIDKKLSEQVNLILHHDGLPEARGRVARPALPRQQHRDRRDAEDPRA